MTKIEKLNRQINDAFTEKMHAAFAEKWPHFRIETYFDLLGSMRNVTRPLSKKKFTVAQHDFLRAYEYGYFAAKEQVRG